MIELAALKIAAPLSGRLAAPSTTGAAAFVLPGAEGTKAPSLLSENDDPTPLFAADHERQDDAEPGNAMPPAPDALLLALFVPPAPPQVARPEPQGGSDTELPVQAPISQSVPSALNQPAPAPTPALPVAEEYRAPVPLDQSVPLLVNQPALAPTPVLPVAEESPAPMPGDTAPLAAATPTFPVAQAPGRPDIERLTASLPRSTPPFEAPRSTATRPTNVPDQVMPSPVTLTMEAASPAAQTFAPVRAAPSVTRPADIRPAQIVTPAASEAVPVLIAPGDPAHPMEAAPALAAIKLPPHWQLAPSAVAPIVAPPAAPTMELSAAPAAFTGPEADTSPTPGLPRTAAPSQPSPTPLPVATPASAALAAIAAGVEDLRPGSPRERAGHALPDAAALLATAAATPAVAAPASGEQPTLDMRQEHWPHDMIGQIERLRDTADAADTRIRLVPDALGQVEVNVRREGDTLHVRFNAEQAQTRALIADAQPRLAEAAEARGLRLGQTSVDAGTAGQGQQQRPATPPSAPPQPRRASTTVPSDAPSDDDRIA